MSQEQENLEQESNGIDQKVEQTFSQMEDLTDNLLNEDSIQEQNEETLNEENLSKEEVVQEETVNPPVVEESADLVGEEGEKGPENEGDVGSEENEGDAGSEETEETEEQGPEDVEDEMKSEEVEYPVANENPISVEEGTPDIIIDLLVQANFYKHLRCGAYFVNVISKETLSNFAAEFIHENSGEITDVKLIAEIKNYLTA